MRKTRALAAGLLLVTALAAPTGSASAESLLQRLFGFWSRAPEAPQTDALGLHGPAYDDEQSFAEDYNTYRTLCVRTCDGFYFPIGDSVRRARLYQDARTCTQRCDGEVRLYYYPTNGGSVETMVDLSGRSYGSLPTAFLYRKSLVAGCSCKPAPWSPQEAARHQGYAAAQAAAATGGGQEEQSRGPAATAQGEGPYFEDDGDAPPPQARRRAAYTRWLRLPWEGVR